MIISEIQRRLSIVSIFIFLCSVMPVFAQVFQPSPPIFLLSSGYGAKALGLSGAFTAVADDLSTIYWNPGGLAQLEGIQFHVDYRHMGDSDEDIAPEVGPNTLITQQRYSISGNQLQAISGSYAFPGVKYAFVPAFAWQRLSTYGPKRDLKEIAGLVTYLDPEHLTFYQSQGDYTQNFKGGQDEFAFALGVRLNPKFMFGGSWSFLHGGVDQRLDGTFQDNLNPGNGQPNVHQDITLQQSTKDSLHGNYLRLGVLVSPSMGFKFAGYVRLPYTQTSDVTLTRRGSVTTDGNAAQLSENATAHTSLDVPTEWGGGIAIQTSDRNIIAASVIYSNWQDAVLTTSNSTDATRLPEGSLPYPTLRADAGLQNSLLQFRAGTQYLFGSPQGGIALRAGIFRDGQPYANQSGDRPKFNGYSFGFGYVASSFRFDIAYVHESGDLTFTPFSTGQSSFTSKRWVFSLDLIGK